MCCLACLISQVRLVELVVGKLAAAKLVQCLVVSVWFLVFGFKCLVVGFRF